MWFLLRRHQVVRGGLVIAVGKKFNSSYFESSDFYVSVDLDYLVLVCVYMPTNYRNEESSRKYASAWASLSETLHKITAANKPLLICGDFNTDLKDDFAPFLQLLLPSLPSGVSVITKSKPFSYVHNSGSTSDLNFVLTNLPEL